MNATDIIPRGRIKRDDPYILQPTYTVLISSARAVTRSEQLVEQFAKEPDAAVGKMPTVPHLYGPGIEKGVKAAKQEKKLPKPLVLSRIVI